MMNKKVRNWKVAFPLAITSLCVAPQSYFLKHWQSFFEGSVPKLKVGFYVLHSGVDLIFFAGPIDQGDDTEWPTATTMDVSLSLPGVCLDNHGQIGDIVETLFPL